MPVDTEVETPSFRLLHVTTDAAGHTVSHRCPAASLSMQRTIGASPPVWASEPVHDTVSRAIWVLPPGWEGGWHANPRRQLVVVLSGRWWVETQDGTRTTMSPGDALLGDDVEALDDGDGHVGHDSAVTGDEPVVLLMIAVDGDADAGRCRDVLD